MNEKDIIETTRTQRVPEWNKERKASEAKKNFQVFTNNKMKH